MPPTDLVGFLRDWIHETPLSLCNAGADTCPDWELAEALADAVDEFSMRSPLAGVARERLMDVTAERVERLSAVSKERARHRV